MKVCSSCGSSLTNEEDLVLTDEGYKCGMCYWNENFVCDMCGLILPMEEMSDKHRVCLNCIDQE
jgi:hypothetical protein